MMSFKQYFKNIWRNRDAYQRKPHGPPQGQGLCHMAHGLRWTREEPVSAGITNGRVFRRAEDQNDVVILHDVADVAKARIWLGSDETKAAREKGGVVGSPNIRFAA